MRKKVIAIIMTCVFLINSAFSWAGGDSLSPWLALSPERQEQFQKEYIQYHRLLAHGAINEYIAQAIRTAGGFENLRQRKDLVFGYGEEPIEIIVAAIPDMFANRGQFAHAGLGKWNGKPVAYVDEDFYFDEEKVDDAKVRIANEKIIKDFCAAGRAEFTFGDKTFIFSYEEPPVYGCQDTGGYVIKVEEGGHSVGACQVVGNEILLNYLDSPYKAPVFILDPYRNNFRRIGQTMLAFALGIAKYNRKYDEFYIKNPISQARSFYRSLGFMRTREKDFIFDLKDQELPVAYIRALEEKDIVLGHEKSEIEKWSACFMPELQEIVPFRDSIKSKYLVFKQRAHRMHTSSRYAGKFEDLFYRYKGKLNWEEIYNSYHRYGWDADDNDVNISAAPSPQDPSRRRHGPERTAAAKLPNIPYIVSDILKSSLHLSLDDLVDLVLERVATEYLPEDEVDGLRDEIEAYYYDDADELAYVVLRKKYDGKLPLQEKYKGEISENERKEIWTLIGLYERGGYFYACDSMRLGDRAYYHRMSKLVNSDEYFTLTYEQAAKFVADHSLRKPFGVYNSRETAKNFILATLDTIEGFRDAREKGDVGKMAHLYREKVMTYGHATGTKTGHHPPGQVAFFHEVGGLLGLISNKRSYMSKTSSPPLLLRIAVPEIFGVGGLEPTEVEAKYFQDVDNATFHINKALDSIPGFEGIRVRYKFMLGHKPGYESKQMDIRKMAGLYRKHAMYYRARVPGKNDCDGQQAFFSDFGLDSLFRNKKPYFSDKPGTVAMIVNLAVPGLVDNDNEAALHTREMSNTVIHPRDGDRAHSADEIRGFLPGIIEARNHISFRGLINEVRDRTTRPAGFVWTVVLTWLLKTKNYKLITQLIEKDIADKPKHAARFFHHLTDDYKHSAWFRNIIVDFVEWLYRNHCDCSFNFVRTIDRVCRNHRLLVETRKIAIDIYANSLIAAFVTIETAATMEREGIWWFLAGKPLSEVEGRIRTLLMKNHPEETVNKWISETRGKCIYDADYRRRLLQDPYLLHLLIEWYQYDKAPEVEFPELLMPWLGGEGIEGGRRGREGEKKGKKGGGSNGRHSGSPAELLMHIRDRDDLLEAAMSDTGVTVDECKQGRPDNPTTEQPYTDRTLKKEFKILVDVGVFEPIDGDVYHCRFSKVLFGEDEGHVKKLINVVCAVEFPVGRAGCKEPLWRGNIPGEKRPIVKEIIRAAVFEHNSKLSLTPFKTSEEMYQRGRELWMAMKRGDVIAGIEKRKVHELHVLLGEGPKIYFDDMTIIYPTDIDRVTDKKKRLMRWGLSFLPGYHFSDNAEKTGEISYYCIKGRDVLCVKQFLLKNNDAIMVRREGAVPISANSQVEPKGEDYWVDFYAKMPAILSAAYLFNQLAHTYVADKVIEAMKDELCRREKRNFKIVQVGSGDGKLLRLLQTRLRRELPEVKFHLYGVDTSADKLSGIIEEKDMTILNGRAQDLACLGPAGEDNGTDIIIDYGLTTLGAVGGPGDAVDIVREWQRTLRTEGYVFSCPFGQTLLPIDDMDVLGFNTLQSCVPEHFFEQKAPLEFYTFRPIGAPEVAPRKKILWHVVEKDVLAMGQQGSFTQAINNASKASKAEERVWIVKGDGPKAIKEAFAYIQALHPNEEPVFDVALSTKDHIKWVPTYTAGNRNMMLVFDHKDGIGSITNVQGILAALRALHMPYDEGVQELLRIYEAMTGEEYRGHCDYAYWFDPKRLARAMVFEMPRAKPLSWDDKRAINRYLLRLVSAA